MFYTPLTKSTKICCSCHKKISDHISLANLFYHSNYLCLACYKNLIVLNKKTVFYDHDILYLYHYNGFIRDLIYRYKTMLDKDLAPIFLDPFIEKINKYYRDYTLIFPPSSNDAIKQRGFSHMELICQTTKLKYLNLFYKTDQHKQSLSKGVDRLVNARNINYFSTIPIPNKVLLIDDIFTTGSTIKACVDLLNGLKINDIKILIIAKT